MELKENVYKRVLVIFGMIFIALSAIELIITFILLNTSVNLYGNRMLFYEMILNLEIMPLSGLLLFFFFISSICYFFIIGIFLFKLSSNKITDNSVRAKNMLIFGVIILIFSFIKLGYITFLGKTEISVSGKLRSFKHIISSSYFAPYYFTVIWVFFTGVICYYLMVGLLFGALGLNWILKIQKIELNES